MSPSLLVGASFAAIMLALFTAQVLHQAYRRAYRRESRDFAFQRVENVYPKFKL